jgi:membrane complex biogenesis BtpA family protein
VEVVETLTLFCENYSRLATVPHMTERFLRTFPGVSRPLIAMAHVAALPGTPLYDASRGIQGIIDDLQRDVDILVAGGFDAVLFCNENDRPYELHPGLASAALMTRVVTECRPTVIPFGVDFLWDAQCALAIGVATEAAFMREVVSGLWESDMGQWSPDAAKLLRDRRYLDADRLAVFANVTPESASNVGSRSPGEVARSVLVSCIPDAILVSGAMAGQEPALETVAEVRESVPAEVHVLLNTGAKAQTIAKYLDYADGCIVGSDLKVDGHTWNPVDPERVQRFVDSARSA